MKSTGKHLTIMFSFKLDRRKILSPSIMKKKPRASLSKCLIKIRGVKFHTHPNGKCLQRLSKILFEEREKNIDSSNCTASDLDTSKSTAKKVEDPLRNRAKYCFVLFFFNSI